MNRIKLLAALAVIALSLAGCGSAGSGVAGGAASDGTSAAADTVISGMASKGPITGSISIFALDASGGKGKLLKSAPIDNGSYCANIGNYAGPILIEVTGSYTDEATGRTLSITSDAPLRAALSNVSGAVGAAVTPLTELAVQKAGTLTAPSIDAGNKLVSDIFRFDVVSTQPVAPTAAAVGSATSNQKDYTLAIAAFSQLSQTRGEPLPATLASLASGIGSGGMNSLTVTNFASAVTAFITANPNNTTGVNDVSATNLAAINGTTSAAPLTYPMHRIKNSERP